MVRVCMTFVLQSSDARNIPTHLELLRRPVRPYVMQHLCKSSFMINTNVNARIIIESRTWFVSSANNTIKYDQDLASAYGLAIAVQIADRIAKDGSFVIKEDRSPNGSIINGDLRMFMNYIDHFENMTLVHQKLSSTVQGFLVDADFYIDVTASVLNSIFKGDVAMPCFAKTVRLAGRRGCRGRLKWGVAKTGRRPHRRLRAKARPIICTRL